MNLVRLTMLVAIITTNMVQAQPKKKQESGWDKVMRTMFPSVHSKVVPAKRKRVVHKPVKKLVDRMYIEVEINWIAKYWEQEAAWDYYIPEDDKIRFEKGKYVVPIVVYRHYEDMANSHRNISPLPDH